MPPPPQHHMMPPPGAHFYPPPPHMANGGAVPPYMPPAHSPADGAPGIPPAVNGVESIPPANTTAPTTATTTPKVLEVVLIYSDNDVSVEEKRAQLDRYRFTHAKTQ